MRKLSRGIAWLICLVMLLGMLPAVSLAADGDDAIDPTIPIFENPQYSFAERAADLVARMTLQQKASEITSQNAPAINAAQLSGGALNVPATKGIGSYTWWSETLHGCRSGVNYPQNTTVASTWNPELYYQEATNIGQEIRERNNTNLNFYSPTINMHRDPRWGRNEESYSEDVLLTAKMGTAWVNGLEGKDREGNVLDPDGYLMAHSTIKHYVANNNEGQSSGDTTGRLRAGAVSSLRMLREYYALPYGEIIRAADVSSVMTAYSYYGPSKTAFDPSSYSSYLMDTLLRQVYGFSGYITGDCDSVNSMQNLHYINYYTGKEITAPEAFAGALAHGEDLECNGGHSSPGSGTSGFKTTYGSQMSAMMGQDTDKGKFTENTVDIALHRLMTARIQTGDLDGNIKIKQDASARNTNTLRDTVRRPLVEQINREGIVMLQNKDNILPLDLSETGISKVAIVGSWQTNGSTGLYAQASQNQQNIQAGIQAAFNAKKSGIQYTLITSNSLSDANKTAIAEADVAIVVTGTSSSYSQEDHDRTTIALPDNQEALINNVAAANPNTVVIMETCGPMRVNRFQDNVKAILWSSFGGQWKNGFGDIMAGYCPSGKTTDTWYNEVNDSGESDVPGITDYDLVPSEGKNGRTYMYYNGSSKPSYPFGYGLSYTTFAYSNLKIIDKKRSYSPDETVKVSFDVKNTGSVAGKEVTQLYVAQPDAPAALKRPIKRLEGFEKIDLEPGETKTVTMEIKIEDLAFFNDDADCFLVDEGNYEIQVGTNSAEANLKDTFQVQGKLTEVPAVVTMKANQAGDTEQGIEERLIYGKNKEVNPQLTVAMNNEKLYGFIISQQHSNIKSMESTPLPEGMEVTYTSNRPEVVKVVDGKVYTAAPGVATLTATVTYNGVTVSGDEVIYVMTNTDVDNITVDGEQIAKFSPTRYKYSMTLENKTHIPVVAVESENPDLEITVEQATELPGVATITAKDKDSDVASVYTITFKLKATGGSEIDFSSLADSGKYEISGQSESEITDAGLPLISRQGGIEPAKQSIAEQDIDVVKVPVSGDWTASLEVEFDTNGAANGYYQFFAFYASQGGDNRNMLGIRGGDGAMQNFERHNGTITHEDEDGVNSAPGFATTGTYYLRIEKAGTTYTCYRSEDGVDWIEMFSYADSGIEADEILIDAFTGMTEGYKFTLKKLTLDGIGGTDWVEATEIVPGQRYVIVADGQYALNNVPTAAGGNYSDGGDSLGANEVTIEGDKITSEVEDSMIWTIEESVDVPEARDGAPTYFIFDQEGGQLLRRSGRTATAPLSVGEMNPASPQYAMISFYQRQDGSYSVYTNSANSNDYNFTLYGRETGFDAPGVAQGSWDGETYQSSIRLYTQGSAPAEKAPEIASISVNGEALSDFDPETAAYSAVVAFDADVEVTAKAGNSATTVEVTKPEGKFGVYTVTGTAGKKTVSYTVAVGHRAEEDFFADGDMNKDLWSGDATVEQGKGIVLKAGDKPIFAPAMSNWEVVAKIVYPAAPGENQAAFLLGQDAENALELTGKDLTADEDGFVTVYLKYKKDGNSVIGSYSQDGMEYTDVLDETVDYTFPQIGLSAGKAAEAYVEYVAVAVRDGLQPDFPAMLAWAAENVADYVAEDLPDTTKEDLAFAPVPHGYELSVESSDPAVIGADGKVTAGKEAKDVEVTVSVTGAGASGSTTKTVKVDADAGDDFLFEDVKDPAKFYFDPVYWAFYADPQITKGTDDTHFGPDNPCTRGHVVTFLWRAAGEPEPKSATTPFTDLKPGAFYEKAVAWAVEEGITKGMTDTTFAPDGKCNRGQIVTFLWRFKGEPAPKSTQTPFTDLKAGAFYEKAVAWAVENDVTKGMTETTFGPDATCTRGQVVTFLYRATQD